MIVRNTYFDEISVSEMHNSWNTTWWLQSPAKVMAKLCSICPAGLFMYHALYSDSKLQMGVQVQGNYKSTIILP